MPRPTWRIVAKKSIPIEVDASPAGTCHWRVSVQVPVERVQQEFERVYRAAARQMRLKGFRPGKVPLAVVKRHYAGSLTEEARRELLQNVLADAMETAGLRPLRILDFDADAIEVAEDQPLAFEFEVETAPEIELAPWEECGVEPAGIEPSEEQVAQAIGELGRNHARFDDAGADQGLDEAHLAECDLQYFRDGQPGPTAEGLRLGLGSPLYGADPEAFVEAFRGIQAGAEVTLPVEFRSGFQEENWVGSTGEARLQVKRIVKPRPATEEEIAEDLGLEGGAGELREKLRQRLQVELERQEQDRQAFEMLEAQARLRPFELPSRLLEEEIEAGLEALARNLQQRGLDEAAARAEADKQRDEITEEAERRLRHFFLMRRVADAEGVRVLPSDLQAAFRALGARHQAAPEAVEAFYREEGLIQQLQSDILEGKVRAKLVEIAGRNAEKQETPAAEEVPEA